MSGRFGSVLAVIWGLVMMPVMIPDASAQQLSEPAVKMGRVTSRPLPRFVSLRASEVNWRKGPGQNYPIAWVYHKKYLPVQVIDEFDVWRQVRDRDGMTGWVQQAMLSDNRTALVQLPSGTNSILVHKSPHEGAAAVLRLQDGVMVTLEECSVPDWCKIGIAGQKAFIRRNFLWGLNPGETLD